MTNERAEQLIVVSLFVLLASTVGGHLAEKSNNKESAKEKEKHFTRKVAGGFLTMLFAGLLGEVAPQPAALLAIGVASYAFFNEGLPAINKHYPNPGKETTERLPNTVPGPETFVEPLTEFFI